MVSDCIIESREAITNHDGASSANGFVKFLLRKLFPGVQMDQIVISFHLGSQTSYATLCLELIICSKISIHYMKARIYEVNGVLMLIYNPKNFLIFDCIDKLNSKDCIIIRP